MKTLNTKNILIGTGTMAAAVAFGMTQASALSLSEFFGFTSHSNLQSSADARVEERANTHTSPSVTAHKYGMIQAETNTKLSESKNTKEASGSSTTNSLKAHGEGESTVRATTSLSASSSTRAGSDTRLGAEADGHLSFIARIAAFFRAFFHIDQDDTADNENTDDNAMLDASSTLDATDEEEATGTVMNPNINASMHATVNGN